MEKTKVMNMLDGGTFGFLGFDFRHILNREKNRYYILFTPKKKTCKAVKAKIREIIQFGGVTPAEELIKRINAIFAGWVEYFRVGNAIRAFSEIRDYLEMKVRTLLARRKRRQKRSVGWRRWSNEYLYGVLGAVLGLENPSPAKCGGVFMKVATGITRTHNPFGETAG